VSDTEKLSDNEVTELVHYALTTDKPRIEGRRVYTSPKLMWKNFTGIMGKVKKTAIREKKETIVAARILRRYLLGKELSAEELKFLKEQSIDLARILPIVAAQAVPAPIPITPFLITLGKKVGIDLIPKEQLIPDSASGTPHEDPKKEPGKSYESDGSE
jgi:hypothetical protein